MISVSSAGMSWHQVQGQVTQSLNKFFKDSGSHIICEVEFLDSVITPSLVILKV